MNRLFLITSVATPSFAHYVTITNGLVHGSADCATILGDFIRTNLGGQESDYQTRELTVGRAIASVIDASRYV